MIRTLFLLGFQVIAVIYIVGFVGLLAISKAGLWPTVLIAAISIWLANQICRSEGE